MPDELSDRGALSVAARRSQALDAYGGGAASGGHGHERHVLVVVWQRKGLVAACVAVALGCGAAYLARATRQYTSTSTLLVQQAQSKIMSDDLTGGAGSAALNLATQCELITSTAVLAGAVDQPPLSNGHLIATLENPVGFLKTVVHAEPSKQSELISVSVTGPVPADAAAIVNAVVGAYIEYQGRQHQSTAVQVAGILQKEVDSHEAELKDEQGRMLRLRLANPELVSQFDRRDQSVTLQSQLARELSVAQLRANELAAAARSAEAARSDPVRLRQLIQMYQLGNLVPPSAVPQVAAEYQRAVATLNHLADTRHLSEDDAVRVAEAEVARARASMDRASEQEAADELSTINVGAAAAADQAKQLRAAFEAEQKATLGLNAKAAEYDQLAGAAQRDERALDVLQTRLKDIDFTKDVGPMTIAVLESAKPNPTPVSPVRSKILGEALVAGLMAGLGAALLADRVDQRLRSIEEIGAVLDAAVLGVIPRVAGRAAAAGAVGRETFLQPRSPTAEAFRTVRTAIYFGSGAIDERATRTILVTSPTPGDGKSTCIGNLAIAVAQAGRRVLLVDADCRRPVQHRTFAVADGPGLSGVLTGRATLAQAVRPTGIDRLDLLACGPLPHNPAELLDSQALLDLLAEAARRYDQVLIDSPPVNLVTDARILAASCDAAVMVLRAERSTRRGAQMAWNVLASVGARRLGVIVNDVTRRTDGYHGYNAYGRYGYGPAHVAEPPAEERPADPPPPPPRPALTALSGTNGTTPNGHL